MNIKNFNEFINESYLEKSMVFVKSIKNLMPLSNIDLNITLLNYLGELDSKKCVASGKLSKHTNDTLMKYGIYKDNRTDTIFVGEKPLCIYFIDMCNAILKGATADKLAKYWEKFKKQIHKEDIYTLKLILTAK